VSHRCEVITTCGAARPPLMQDACHEVSWTAGDGTAAARSETCTRASIRGPGCATRRFSPGTRAAAGRFR